MEGKESVSFDSSIYIQTCGSEAVSEQRAAFWVGSGGVREG